MQADRRVYQGVRTCLSTRLFGLKTAALLVGALLLGFVSGSSKANPALECVVIDATSISTI